MKLSRNHAEAETFSVHPGFALRITSPSYEDLSNRQCSRLIQA